jgi:hypothetical protein
MPLRCNRVIHAIVLALFFSTLCAGQAAPLPARAAAGNSASALSGTASPGNWSQLAKLETPGDTLFGGPVAISGDTLVLTQLAFTGPSSAIARVFLETQQGWRNTAPVATLSGPIPEEVGPAVVAIDGDTIVVAANIGFDGYTGLAFVYVKPANGWTDMASPTAVLSTSIPDVDFGDSVSIGGDTIVIGAEGYFSDSPGRVYVYTKPAGGWQDMTETAKLTASDGLSTDLFGHSVAVSGGTIVIGADQYGKITDPGPGKAYVFVEPSTGWTSTTQTAELTSSNPVDGNNLGSSVAIEGNTVLVGSANLNKFFGGALVFEKPASGWVNETEAATLTPGDNQEGDAGVSVALSGRIAFLGAPYRSPQLFGGIGGIYVFEEPASGWQNASSSIVLTGADARWGNNVGFYMAASGKVVVGSTLWLPDLAEDVAYVFGLQ